MLILLERSGYSICCRGVSSVICSITSFNKLALCVCVYKYILKNPLNTNPKIKTNKNPLPNQFPSRFFREMSITLTLLTRPLSSFQITLLESVLLLSPLSCFFAYFPLLCSLFFLVCSAFAFSETHKKETSGSFTKNHTCATDHLFPSA